MVEAEAEMGELSEQDRILISYVKLRGTAEIYLNTHLKLQEEITYDMLKAIIIERFLGNASRCLVLFAKFQKARQRKDENPEEFADRLRSLNERTIIKAETNEVRRVLHAEADSRLLAQYVAGLG